MIAMTPKKKKRARKERDSQYPRRSKTRLALVIVVVPGSYHCRPKRQSQKLKVVNHLSFPFPFVSFSLLLVLLPTHCPPQLCRHVAFCPPANDLNTNDMCQSAGISFSLGNNRLINFTAISTLCLSSLFLSLYDLD